MHNFMNVHGEIETMENSADAVSRHEYRIIYIHLLIDMSSLEIDR